MTTAMPAKIKIDPEFRDYLPALGNDEKSRLETSLKNEGCLEPLLLWNDTLVDGHHRFEICSRLKVPYETKQIGLPDRDSAFIWIIEHQLAKRNLTDAQRDHFIGTLYNNRPKIKTGRKANGETRDKLSRVSADGHPISASIAKQFKMSEKTVRRKAKAADTVNDLGKLCSDAKQAILRGDVKLTDDDATRVNALSATKKKTVAKEVASKKHKSVGAALQAVMPVTFRTVEKQPVDKSVVKFDDAKIEKTIEQLVTMVDERGEIFGKDERFKTTKAAADQIQSAWRSWKNPGKSVAQG